MSAIAIQANKVRPLPGCIVRQKEVSGASVTNGMTVKLNSDETISKTSGSTDKVYGVVTTDGDKDGTAEIGDTVAVVTFGPVAGFTGQVGTLAYLAATAGGLDTAGTVAAGYFETAQVFTVMPAITNIGS